jgi:hypothetical protein
LEENVSDFSLKGIIKLAVCGVPALLILLGGFLYVSGITLELATGNAEMKTTGIMVNRYWNNSVYH